MYRPSRLIVSGFVVLLSASTVLADEPPFKGQLKGADAAKAAEIEGRLLQHRTGGELAEALAAAKEVLALRVRLQGANHWQATDLKIEVESLERMLGQPAEVQREFASIPLMDGEATRLRDQGAYVKAEALERKLLEVRLRVFGDNHRDVAMSHNNIGFNLYGQGKFAEALECQRKALDGRRKALGDAHVQVAASYGNLGQTLRALGRLGEAQPLFEKALATWLEVAGEDYPETAHAYNNLGLNLHEQGKYKEAEKQFRTALAMHLRVLGEDHVETATSYSFLAYSLSGTGRHAEAQPLFQKAYQIQHRVRGESHPETIIGLNNVGMNLQSQGDLAGALPFCRQAYEMAQRYLGANNPTTLRTTFNLAVSLNYQGKFAEAQTVYDETLAVVQRLFKEDHPEMALYHSHLGANLTALERHAEARPHYEKALAIRRAVYGENHLETSRSYNGLANSLREAGKYADAQHLYQKSIDISRALLGEAHRDTALGYANLALNLACQGKFADAQPLYDKAVTLAAQASGQAHPETIGCMTRAALNLYLLGRTRAAATSMQGASRAYEMARLRISSLGLERSLVGTGSVPFPYEAVFLARLGNTTDAWQALERSLARGLLDETRARTSRELPAEQRTTLDRLNQRYADLRPNILRLVLQREQTAQDRAALHELLTERGKLEDQLATIAAERSQAEVLPLDAIQKALARRASEGGGKGETALVTWIDLRNQTGSFHEHWACVVRASGAPVWVQLPGSGPNGAWTSEDDELPDLVRQSLARRRSPPAGDAVARLRRQRLESLRPHLNGVTHLLVVPIGLMANVPVEALSDEFTISYVPSGTQLVRLRDKPASTQPAGQGRALLAVADPIFAAPAKGDKSAPAKASDRPLPKPLPGTAREVRAIAALFPSATTLLGSDASEQKLQGLGIAGQLGQFQVLHFATHGVADSRQSFESALVLAQDALPDPVKQRLEGKPPVDGKLTAREVLDGWKLNADLVVLSACESALGRQGGGDGLLGFSQAFLLAGARSVILSLWQVDDVATALLMVRFYENWLGRDSSGRSRSRLAKAEALKEAKNWLRGLRRQDVEQRLASLPEGARGLKLDLDPSVKPQPADRPFDHPYYWSAFILIGDAD